MRKSDDLYNLNAQHEHVDAKDIDPELDIKVEELTWSKDNVDTDLLHKASDRAWDYILKHHEPFGVRDDIDKDTARPTIYLDNEDTGKTIEIPLTTMESMDWDLFEIELKNQIDDFKNKYGQKKEDLNDSEPKMAA